MQRLLQHWPGVVQPAMPFGMHALPSVAPAPPHWFATPPPPHVCGRVHVPQLRRLPQPSPGVPQVAPSDAHVCGMHPPPPSAWVPPPHWPPEHTPAGQLMPHPPQFLLSFCVLTHTLPQHTDPAPHV